MTAERSMTTVTAERKGCDPLVITYDAEEGMSREMIALRLLMLAQERHQLIPDGRRGASKEERLAEYGYVITTTSTSLE